MNLAISNIAWQQAQDQQMYGMMKEIGFTGLEIAPTRVFPVTPYKQIGSAYKWSREIEKVHGFSIPSMQSIWYGKKERIFESQEQRQILTEYSKCAIDFAAAIGCCNLVFGCPQNRNVAMGEDINAAIPFFRELGEYAYSKGTIIGMEANPPIYNTNFINTTTEALDFISEVDSKGFRLNLDVGTMIENKEAMDVIKKGVQKIQHIHISEPYLKPIKERTIHKELSDLLKEHGYQGFVSIEMGTQENLDVLKRTMIYVKETFG